MDRALVGRIARSVLYEGYMLYPYRTTSIKNAGRCMFGTLYPPEWVAAKQSGDRSEFQAEALFSGPSTAKVTVVGRYLLDDVETEHEMEAAIGEARRVEFPSCEVSFVSALMEHAQAGNPAALYRLTVKVRNTGADASQPPLYSAHAVISVSEGELISVTDPPPEFAEAAAKCVNIGVWPVLIGAAGARDAMLAAPIILPDYPETAPESAGDLSDATEIEEILTLRILTLTDREKAEVRESGDYARGILDRSENLPAEHLMKLHGTIRGMSRPGPVCWSEWDNWANAPAPTSIRVEGAELKAGDRVRLRPGSRSGSRGDIFDTALAGRTAIIAGIEQDFEDKVQVAVVVEDDPGRDLGEQRQTGHRFFFSPEEIELP